MVAFIWNLSFGETVLIVVVAVMVFGRNLPDVAGRVFGQMRKMRRAFDDLRRESGIDREMRKFQGSIHEAVRDLDVEAREPRSPARVDPQRGDVERVDPETGERRAPRPEIEAPAPKGEAGPPDSPDSPGEQSDAAT